MMLKQYILLLYVINLSLANNNITRQNNDTKDEDRCDTPEACSQCAYQVGKYFLSISPEMLQQGSSKIFAVSGPLSAKMQ